MTKFLQNISLWLVVGSIATIALNSTLYDMTVADCNAGIQLACDEVNQRKSQHIKFQQHKLLKLGTIQLKQPDKLFGKWLS